MSCFGEKEQLDDDSCEVDFDVKNPKWFFMTGARLKESSAGMGLKVPFRMFVLAVHIFNGPRISFSNAASGKRVDGQAAESARTSQI